MKAEPPIVLLKYKKDETELIAEFWKDNFMPSIKKEFFSADIEAAAKNLIHNTRQKTASAIIERIQDFKIKFKIPKDTVWNAALEAIEIDIKKKHLEPKARETKTK